MEMNTAPHRRLPRFILSLSPRRSHRGPNILPSLNLQTRFARPARFVETLCERSFDLSPVFSSPSALFAHNGDLQPLCHQSLAHSFPFNGRGEGRPTTNAERLTSFHHPPVTSHESPVTGLFVDIVLGFQALQQAFELRLVRIRRRAEGLRHFFCRRWGDAPVRVWWR